MNFIKIISAGVLAIYQLAFSLFLPQKANEPEATMSATPTIVVEMLSASGSYSNEGQTVNVAMEFPKYGGDVQGSFSGDCEGSLIGMYKNNSLEGSGSGVCKMPFFTFDATITYTGSVDVENQKVKLDFKGKAEKYTHEGNVQLQIN